MGIAKQTEPERLGFKSLPEDRAKIVAPGHDQKLSGLTVKSKEPEKDYPIVNEILENCPSVQTSTRKCQV